MHRALARISAIEATFGGRSASRPTRAASPDAIQATFNQVMARASASPTLLPPAGSPYRTLGEYAGGFGQSQIQHVPHSHHAQSHTAPPGLERYQNGRIPEAALAPIPGTGERMWSPAAAAFTRMRDEALRAGIELPIIDAYRPFEDQVRLARELGLYREGGLAAEPGTSEHGWGRALDLEVDDKAVAWLRSNAARFGFVEAVPREPWHWEYHG